MKSPLYRSVVANLLSILPCLVLSMPSRGDVLLYDPFPVASQGDSSTYQQNTNLSGSNATVFATEGTYAGSWQWPANFAVTATGLEYTHDSLQLVTAGGSIEKQHGDITYRNFTARKFASATKITTYFSYLIRFKSFGEGVDTRAGLGNYNSGLKYMAYLSVNSSGLATAYMYDSVSSTSVQLDLNRTYLVVGVLEYDVTIDQSTGNERLTLYLQPRLDLSDAPDLASTGDFQSAMTVYSSTRDDLADYVGSRGDEGMNNNVLDADPADMAIDEWRVGTTWLDVVPSSQALILHDAFPTGDGSNSLTYIAAQNLASTNGTVLAQTGLWAGAWQWGANFQVTDRNLTFIGHNQKLQTSDGSLSKLYGDTSFRNYTVRKFSGATRQTTYFSAVAKWDSFGSGVDTRIGLAADSPSLNMMAYLRVTSAGVAYATLYTAQTSQSVTLAPHVNYMIVGKLEYDVDASNAERLTLWLQPDMDSDNGPDASGCLTRFEVTSSASDWTANMIGARSDDGMNGTQVDVDPIVFAIDEYRVGLTYRAVVPFSVDDTALYGDLINTVPTMTTSLGSRMPIFIWGNPLQYDVDDDTFVTELYQRGLCYSPNYLEINTTDRNGVYNKLHLMQQHGYFRPIVMQTFGNNEFASAKHTAPAKQDSENYPGLGDYQSSKATLLSRMITFLNDLSQTQQLTMTTFLFDWETWCRSVIQQNPATNATLIGQYDEALLCPHCDSVLPTSYLDTLQGYLTGTETLRAQILKDCLFDPVHTTYPAAKAGNYYTISHVKTSDPLGTLTQAVGWYGSNADFSMPIYYGNNFNQMYDPDKVGWNLFKLYLQNLTELTRNQVSGQFQIPWVCRILYQHAVVGDENACKMVIQAPSGPKTTYAWPRDAYREFLRHALLRGAKTFAIFSPNKGEAQGNREHWLMEASDALTVINEMNAYGSILDTGTILNSTDIPGDPYNLSNAVVWSGMATADTAVIRAKSFTGYNEWVEIPIFDRVETVLATPQGTTYQIDR